jgi:hypothetical protein
MTVEDLRKRYTRGFFETATAAIIRKHLRFTPEKFSVMSSTNIKKPSAHMRSQPVIAI